MTESTEVVRLFGGPGSGKTTALLDRVEQLLEENDDVDVRDVLVVSYTRAAAAEIRERLAERLDTTPRSLRGNVSTMHAKAYDLLNLSRPGVRGRARGLPPPVCALDDARQQGDRHLAVAPANPPGRG